uniref:RIKEN cDNA 1700113H08 gene n=1 Tax=Cricetulus griseus TaxID=10029 RepID=A0A8C2MBU1_CRIGR
MRQKSNCYIPIVRSMILWERGTPHTSPNSHYEKRALPCARFLTHMKDFSASRRSDQSHLLSFPGFVERTHSSMSDERELYNCEHTIPSSPASTISLDEYIYGEDSPTPSLSSEMNEDVFFFTVKKWMQKRPRGPPKQAWTSPFFEKQAENKLKRSHSVNTTISLEAEGRHIPLQNHPLRNSKGNSGPALRPFTAIGLCRSISQSSSSQQVSCKTSSESVSSAASRSSTNTDSLSICGNALGRGSVAIKITPAMTPKHPHPPTEHRSKSAGAFRVCAAKEPLPLIVGCATHLFTRKLKKACSSAAPRPPGRFHTACSQTPSRQVVNAHLH